MKIITTANQKGGVGKTTLTSHLGYAAAGAGLRTLMLDLDPQGSLSIGLNVLQPDAEHLVAADLFSETFIAKPIAKVDEQMSVIPSDDALFDLLNANTDDVIRARDALRSLSSKFDVCLIDTPPERNPLLVTALAVADAVVTPMTLGLYEQGGVEKLFNTINGVRAALNPTLRHLGILLMKTNGRSSREKEMVQEMRTSYGDYVLSAELPERAAVRNAVNNRVPVWERPRGSSHDSAAREWKAACNLILTEGMK